MGRKTDNKANLLALKSIPPASERVTGRFDFWGVKLKNDFFRCGVGIKTVGGCVGHALKALHGISMPALSANIAKMVSHLNAGRALMLSKDKIFMV